MITKCGISPCSSLIHSILTREIEIGPILLSAQNLLAVQSSTNVPYELLSTQSTMTIYIKVTESALKVR